MSLLKVAMVMCFFIGLAYMGYMSTVLEHKVSEVDRVLTVVLGLLGNLFVVSKMAELPNLFEKMKSFFRRGK